MSGLACRLAAAALTVGGSLWAEPLDVPFFRQQKNGCGAASVAMVMHYWTRNAASPEPAPDAGQVYRRLYRTGQKGIALADMRSYLEESGFRAFTLRAEWADIERHLERARPAIVGLRPDSKKGIHFAVVAGVDGNRVWLNDPTRRKPSRMKRSDFLRQWRLADQWMLLAAKH